MKYLIILDNTNRYDNKFGNVVDWLDNNMYKCIQKNDFSFIVFGDGKTVDEIYEKFKDLQISIDKNEFYIVLHDSAIQENKEQKINEFKTYFKTENVICQSHIDGDFYYTKMRKLISDEDISFADVAEGGFFPTDDELDETSQLKFKIKLLYELLAKNNSDTTKKEYKELKQEYEDLPDFPDEIDDEFIRQVRDLILDKTF